MINFTGGGIWVSSSGLLGRDILESYTIRSYTTPVVGNDDSPWILDQNVPSGNSK